MNRLFRSLVKPILAATVMCGAVGSASAQLSPIVATRLRLGAGVKVTTAEGRIQLKVGDTVEYKGHVYVISDSLFAPAPMVRGNDPIIVNGVKGTVSDIRSTYAVAGVYPLVVWSVAGSVQQDDLGFAGGTQSFDGFLGSLDVGFHSPQGPLTELGGWFYQPSRPGDGNLYQIHGRLFFNDFTGFQLAFLNTTTSGADARSISVHGLFRLDSEHTGPFQGRNWAMQLGLGFLNNQTTPQALPITGGRSSSVNFSTFLQSSFEVAPRTSISASYWYIRDRNVDITRFSVGVGFQF